MGSESLKVSREDAAKEKVPIQTMKEHRLTETLKMEQ